MPELPEVETTLRGIEPHLLHREILGLELRQPQLRWPVPVEVNLAVGRRVRTLRRRAKYLLVDLGDGGLMIHLGMSGSLRLVPADESPGRHDHYDILLPRARLRFNDPRRFGSLLWWDRPVENHPLLKSLGPEPLGGQFTGDYLKERSAGRRLPVKNFIMDGRIVAGVGNIYASEALFMAGINPSRQARRISLARYRGLATALRDVLRRAIEDGGTTLRDYVNSGGLPGYFAQNLLVYGRAGRDCIQCGLPVRQKVIGQRSSFYCPACQR